MVPNHYRPLTQRHSAGEVWVVLAKGREDMLRTRKTGGQTDG